MASDATKTKVTVVMLRKGEPMSIQEIALRTGQAYNTVKGALVDLKAIGEGVYPVRYTLPDMELLRSAELEQMEVPEKGWARWYNEDVKAQLASQLSPDSDPAQWADALGQLSMKLGGLAHSLDTLRQDPDWYAKIGGTRKQALK